MPSRTARNARDRELTKKQVIFDVPALALVDLHYDLGLIGDDRADGLHPADGHSGIAMDDGQEVAGPHLRAELLADFDAQRERSDVGDDHVLDAFLPAEQPGLHRGTESDGFIRIEPALRAVCRSSS